MVTNTTETANEAATELESEVALVENAYAYLTDKKYPDSCSKMHLFHRLQLVVEESVPCKQLQNERERRGAGACQRSGTYLVANCHLLNYGVFYLYCFSLVEAKLV